MSIFRDLSLDLSADNRKSDALGVLGALVFSPAFQVLFCYRVSRLLIRNFGMLGKLFAKLLWLRNVRHSGCYISPLAEMAGGIALPHPVSIVIGEGVIIGSGSIIYQGVTLGRSSFSDPKYPNIMDDVTIYAGAVVLGAIHIERGASVAANAVVIKDVAAGDVVGGVPAKVISKTGK